MKRVVVLLASCAACGDSPTAELRADRYVAISAGYFHTCALTALGRVYCWGANESGTLGDGTRTTRLTPTPVSGGTNIAALDAGAGHTCVLTSTRRAICWGQNDEGQVGDGTFIPRDLAVPVVGSLTFTSISAGHAHTCALTADGDAYCWGDDSRGQLGNGATGTARSAIPVRVLLAEPVALLDAGYYQTCAVTRTGGAWCWGANESGQLGNGTTDDAHFPMRVTGIDGASLIATGDRFVCALRAGAAWCWGSNAHGVIGAGVPAASLVPVRVQAPVFTTLTTAIGASTVGTAEAYVCGLTGGGQVFCWGGATRALRAASSAPALLPAPIRLHAITAGAQHLCALDAAGDAWCGGANYAGQLGTDGRLDRDRLARVTDIQPSP